MKSINSIISVSAISAAMITLGGCGAISTEMHHGSLKVNSHISESIFLEPIENKDKSVYVKFRNTSDQQGFNPQQALVADLQKQGWQVINDPAKAHVEILGNIVSVGKVNRNQLHGLLSAGFGDAILGEGSGALAGAAITGTGEGALAGGAIAGAGSWLADQVVQDVTYATTTDIQLEVELPKGQTAQNNTVSNLSQGTSTQERQTLSGTSDRLKYRTRIVSYADKVNLDFKEAEPVLEQQLATSIAGILS
jgi:hypothetical protein